MCPWSTGSGNSPSCSLLEQLALPTHLRWPIARRAEGNPFYVEEMVRALRQAGTPDAQLPDTLQGVLQARLDALPPATRWVAQAAAVIGRIFPLRLLQVLAGDGGDLWTHLLELQRADFVQEQERIPEPSFAFRHILLQEAAYQTLLRRERRTLHLRLAETLEREERGDPAVLAHHFRLAEAWERAFAYAVRAGQAARSLAALQEALAHYDAALAIARDHPESVADAAVVLRAELARGECLWPLGRLREMRLHHAAMLRRHA